MTTLAGQVLKDTVGNNVTDLAPLFRSGEMKFAEQVLAGLDIPQAELRAQPLLFAPDPSGHESPDAKRAPSGEIRHGVDLDNTAGDGGGIDDIETAALPQIADNDIRDVAGDLVFVGRAGQNPRHRNRHGFGVSR